ncbi:hypothetical protein E2562_008139 [Oryza meyeriana var. granulata]|uniref:Uncharacterized protein n=1 Tax=Oryza meyeriana var. granulata TaxID=110450 RepID=A0A6G1CEE8_9ORYZ|nr:hypothetical protein E2562_008139 [Oryza meyeriana var. granulata]
MARRQGRRGERCGNRDGEADGAASNIFHIPSIAGEVFVTITAVCSVVDPLKSKGRCDTSSGEEK